MKLIESKAEYIPQEEGLEGIYKMIELAGRTAYHSQDKITPDSAKNFVDRMIKSRHGACLEHGTVYLAIPITTNHAGFSENHYRDNPYSRFNESLGLSMKDEYGDKCDCWCITTNYRVLVENNWLDDLQYLCSPTEFHEKRYTMRFTCSRAIAQELTRHRVFSYLMESQRYINYSKEKHGGGITFIEPTWINDDREFNWSEAYDNAYEVFYSSCEEAEGYYMTLIEEGFTPQQARDVLPNATKTELIMLGFASDYRYLFDLRLFGKTGAPHPDMVDLMQKAQKAMQEAGIWEDIISKPSKFE